VKLFKFLKVKKSLKYMDIAKIILFQLWGKLFDKIKLEDRNCKKLFLFGSESFLYIMIRKRLNITMNSWWIL
jgi:hypothetical protein